MIAMHRTLEEAARSANSSAPQPRDHGADGADRLHAHARAFEFVEVEDEPGERVDLPA